MHYAEYCMPNDAWPLLFSPMNHEIERVYDLNEYFITTEEIHAYLKGWLRVQSIAEKRNLMRHGKIGDADCMLFNIKEVIDIYENEIQYNINDLFCIKYQPANASA
jgi:aminoglycoside 3-N-acetyltransferase